MIRIAMIFAFALGMGVAQQQDQMLQPHQLKIVKDGITKAGWLFADGKYRASAVELRRSQRQFEKMMRAEGAYVDQDVKKQYARLQKAHKLLTDKGMRLVTLKPLQTSGTSNQPNTGGTNRTDNPFANPRSQTASPFGSSSKDKKTDSASPFGSGSKAGGGKRSGSPFGSPSKPKSDQRSGSPFGSPSKPNSDQRSGSPFGSTNKPPADNPSDSVNPFGSLNKPDSSSKSGSPFGSTAKPKSPPKDSGDSNPFSKPANKISFTKDIAPILVSRCGTCHVRGSRGDFSAATYKSLVGDDSIVSPGKPKDSSLIQMIEDGNMPPKGSVPAADLKKLRQWITQGAEFDGDDDETNITTFAPNSGHGGR